MEEKYKFQDDCNAKFQEEREKYLEALEEVQAELSHVQQGRERNLQYLNKIVQLHNQISESNSQLLHKRMCTHHQQAQIASLSVEQRQNHHRMYQLLQLTDPNTSSDGKLSLHKKPQESKNPSSQTTLNLCKEKEKHLQEEIAHFEYNYNRRIEEFMQQRAKIISSYREQVSAMLGSVKQLVKDINSKELNLHETTTEYLSLRHTTLIYRKEAELSYRGLLKYKEHFQQKCDEIKENEQRQIQLAKDTFGEETKIHENDLKEQINDRLNLIALIGEQHNAVQGAFKKKLEGLTQKYKASKKKFKTLRQRVSLELEGYTHELAGLQKKIDNLQLVRDNLLAGCPKTHQQLAGEKQLCLDIFDRIEDLNKILNEAKIKVSEVNNA